VEKGVVIREVEREVVIVSVQRDNKEIMDSHILHTRPET
jgi:hypothetical protein